MVHSKVELWKVLNLASCVFEKELKFVDLNFFMGVPGMLT